MLLHVSKSVRVNKVIVEIKTFRDFESQESYSRRYCACIRMKIENVRIKLCLVWTYICRIVNI